VSRRAALEQQMDRERWKAHGIGMAIVLFRLHVMTPPDTALPMPDTSLGALDPMAGLEDSTS